MTRRYKRADRATWNAEHRANYEARERAMTAQGFPPGQRVTVQRDAHPDLPPHVRFHAGDEGVALLNLAHGPDTISVRFAGSGIPHAINVNDLAPVTP